MEWNVFFFKHNSIQKLNQFPRMFTEQKYGDVPHESWWPIEYATEWLIQNSGAYLVEKLKHQKLPKILVHSSNMFGQFLMQTRFGFQVYLSLVQKLGRFA